MDVAVMRAILEADASELLETVAQAEAKLRELGRLQVSGPTLKVNVEMPNIPGASGSGASGSSGSGPRPSTANPAKVEATTQATIQQIKQTSEARQTAIQNEGAARRIVITETGTQRVLGIQQASNARLEANEQAHQQHMTQMQERAQVEADLRAQRKSPLSNRLGNFANNQMQSGFALSASITAPIVGGATYGFNLLNKYNAALGQTTALTNIGANEIAGLNKQILDLAQNNDLVRQTPEQLAQGLYFVASTTDDASDAFKILKESSIGASAGLGDTSTVAGIVTAKLAAYRENGDAAAKTTDVLTEAVKVGRGEADQFASAFAKVIPLGAQLGISFEQLGANLAVATKIGFSPDEAATGLENLLNKVAAPTKAGKAQLASMGLSPDDLQGMVKSDGLLNSLLEIQKRSHGSTEALHDLFGNVRGLNDFLATAARQPQAYAEALRAMENADGSAAKAARDASDTIAFQMDRIQAAFEASVLKVTAQHGPRLTHYLSDLASAIPGQVDGIVRMWDSLDGSTQKLIIDLVAVAAAAGPIKLVAANVGYLMQALVSAGTWAQSGGLMALLGNPAAMLAIVAAIGVGYLAWDHYSSKIKAVAEIQRDLAANTQQLGVDFKKALDFTSGDTGINRALAKLREQVTTAGDDIPKLNAALQNLTTQRHMAEISARLSPTEKSAVLESFDNIAARIEARKIDVNLKLSQESKTMLDTLSQKIADAVNMGLQRSGLGARTTGEQVKSVLAPVWDSASTGALHKLQQLNDPLPGGGEFRGRLDASDFGDLSPALASRRRRAIAADAAAVRQAQQQEQLYRLGVLRRPAPVHPLDIDVFGNGPVRTDPLIAGVGNLGRPTERDPNQNPGLPDFLWERQQAQRRAEMIKANAQTISDVSKASLSQLNAAVKHYDRLVEIDKGFGRDYFGEHPNERGRRDAILARRNELQRQAASTKPKFTPSGPDEGEDSKAKRAALKAERDTLSDTASYWDHLAAATEHSVERQLNAVKELQGALQGFFGGLQDQFAHLGFTNDPLGPVIKSLEKALNLSGQAHAVADPAISTSEDLRRRAAGNRSEVERLNGLDGEVPSKGGGMVRASGPAPSWLQAMEASTGKTFGRNCAEEITARLRTSGFNIGAISGASRKSAWQVDFDNNGRLPAGTIVRYPPGHGGFANGHYTAIGSDQAHWTESNMRRDHHGPDYISTDRPINWQKLQRDVEAGRAYAFAPPGSLTAVAAKAYTPTHDVVAPRVPAHVAADYEQSHLREVFGEFTGGLSKLNALPSGWGKGVRDVESNSARFSGQMFLATNEGTQLLKDLAVVLKQRDKAGNNPFVQELSKELGAKLTIHGTGENAAADLFRQILNQADVKLNTARTAQTQDDAGAAAQKARRADIKERGTTLRDNLSMLQLESSLIGSVGRSQSEVNDLIEIEGRRRERVAALLKTNEGLAKNDPRRITGPQAKSIADSEAAIEKQTAAQRRSNQAFEEMVRLRREADQAAKEMARGNLLAYSQEAQQRQLELQDARTRLSLLKSGKVSVQGVDDSMAALKRLREVYADLAAKFGDGPLVMTLAVKQVQQETATKDVEKKGDETAADQESKADLERRIELLQKQTELANRYPSGSLEARYQSESLESEQELTKGKYKDKLDADGKLLPRYKPEFETDLKDRQREIRARLALETAEAQKRADEEAAVAALDAQRRVLDGATHTARERIAVEQWYQAEVRRIQGTPEPTATQKAVDTQKQQWQVKDEEMEQVRRSAEQARDIFRDSIKDGMQHGIIGGLEGMAERIRNAILDAAVDKLATQLAGNLFGQGSLESPQQASQAAGGGAYGVLGSVFGHHSKNKMQSVGPTSYDAVGMAAMLPGVTGIAGPLNVPATTPYVATAPSAHSSSFLDSLQPIIAASAHSSILRGALDAVGAVGDAAGGSGTMNVTTLNVNTSNMNANATFMTVNGGMGSNRGSGGGPRSSPTASQIVSSILGDVTST